MKQFFCLCFILLMASCYAVKESDTLENSSVEGSLDAAKVYESGSSSIRYNSKTGVNVYGGTVYYIGGTRVTDNIGDYEPFPDTLAVRKTDDSNPRWGVKFGLEYVGKGAKFESGQGYSLNYLEVPLNVLYEYPLGPGSLRGGLGPYFAEGIGGGGANGVYGENAGGFKRFDGGLNFMVGYKLPMGLYLDLGYDLGLANIEYPNQDVTGHNRSFSINLGFQIGKLFAGK
jgi:hypothetical protein